MGDNNVVLHDYNVKLPRLPSSYTFYVGNVVWIPVRLFFTAAHFSFFMFSFQVNSVPLFFISRSSSFTVIHVSVDIKIKSKKRTRLSCCFFSRKIRVAMQLTAKTRGFLKWEISSPAYMNG